MISPALSLAERSAARGFLSSNRFKTATELVARFLLAAAFFYSAFPKNGNYAALAAQMSSHSAPGSLVALVRATEAASPLAFIIGWQTQIAAVTGKRLRRFPVYPKLLRRAASGFLLRLRGSARAPRAPHGPDARSAR